MNMTINNFDIIKSLLKFESEDDFYHLQIIKRKKEHPDLTANSHVIKTYYIQSFEYFDSKFPEIISLCDFRNARACINLNRRSFERVAFQMLRKVTEQILNKDYASVRKAYESVCGSHSNEPNKSWIIDIDEKNYDSMPIINFIQELEPKGGKFKSFIPTKNGHHIIVSPFNVAEFKKEFPLIDIHKDNPTLLYMT